MKFGRIVLQVSTNRLKESDFYVTSYFQNGGYDVRPPFSDAYAAASTGCPLAGRARVMSLAHPTVPGLYSRDVLVVYI